MYGSGTQTRGFLNIRDTLQCVELATLHPAEPGEFRVFNQFTEQFSVRELAELVRSAAGSLGIDVTIESYPNPRVEAEHHYYNAANRNLLDLGLQPHLLGDELVQSMLTYIERHRDRVITRAIEPRVRWRPDRGPSEATVLAADAGRHGAPGPGGEQPAPVTRRFVRD